MFEESYSVPEGESSITTAMDVNRRNIILRHVVEDLAFLHSIRYVTLDVESTNFGFVIVTEVVHKFSRSRSGIFRRLQES